MKYGHHFMNPDALTDPTIYAKESPAGMTTDG